MSLSATVLASVGATAHFDHGGTNDRFREVFEAAQRILARYN